MDDAFESAKAVVTDEEELTRFFNSKLSELLAKPISVGISTWIDNGQSKVSIELETDLDDTELKILEETFHDFEGFEVPPVFGEILIKWIWPTMMAYWVDEEYNRLIIVIK